MSNSAFAPRHVYFPASKHETTVIFLHDRNSTGPELAGHLANSSTVYGETLCQHFPNTRWVFPSARAKHFYWTEADRQQLSRSNKDSTTEWFQPASSPADIQLASSRQLATLQESASYILRVIDDEIARVGNNPEKVFLAGFGQGMALGLVVLLCIHHKIGGFIGFNGWMPFAETLSDLLEQNQVEEAGGFFKSKFIAAAQHTYLQQRQHQQLSREMTLFPSAHPSPQPITGSIAEPMAPKVAVPAHVKLIPLFLSHSNGGDWLDNTDPLTIIKQIGFSQISGNIYPGQDETKGAHSPFGIAEQLGDMIGIFEDLHLAGSQHLGG